MFNLNILSQAWLASEKNKSNGLPVSFFLYRISQNKVSLLDKLVSFA